MVERNLFREGFLDNTVNASGTISGSQFVTIQERERLVDEDLTTTALTISGGEFIAITGDFGNCFTISISDNDVYYTEVTMTGAPPRYAGPVPVTVVSGSPRYVRLEHSPAIDTDSQEWRAINDDTLVDFGLDGTQTEAQIPDSPIGKVSDTVTELELFNQFTRTATGFVFIDETGDPGDDNIEIAVSRNGPWYGRNTLNSVQPDNSPWEVGSFNTNELRLVPSGAYTVDFADDIKGWGTTGFTSSTTSENSLKGINSTNTTPGFFINNSFGGSTDYQSPICSTGTYGINPTAFGIIAADYDKVKAKLTVPDIPREDLIEGPRLFWRDQGDAGYDFPRSTIATNSGVSFAGQPQEFEFDVGSTTTWSGTVRSFLVRAWTTVTGLGISAHINNFDVYHSSQEDRLALAIQPAASGTQVIGGSGPENEITILSFYNTVMHPCIITGIEYNIHPPCQVDAAAFFLARLKEGNVFPSAGAVGQNFEVKYIHLVKNTMADHETVIPVHEPVWWGAEPGDFIGFGWSTRAGCSVGEDPRMTYSTGFTNFGWETSGYIPAGTNTTTLSEALDIKTFTDSGRRYNLRYSMINDSDRANGLAAIGTYTTPIFDTGAAPGLTSARFTAIEEDGTSVDISGGFASAENTLNARASSDVPNTTTPLGDTNAFRNRLYTEVVSYRLNGGYVSTASSNQNLGSGTAALNATGWSINTENTYLSSIGPAGSLDGDTYVENIGAALFYHELKDEMWVLNVMLSGTVPNNMVPVWDRYDLRTGRLISTDAMQGLINYTYFHPEGNDNDDVDARIFEPVCFLPDYDREEIYIITRLPGEGGVVGPFAVGSSKYLGVKMDLDGNYKGVIWDTASAAFDTDNMPEDNGGIPATHPPIQAMRDIEYDGSYFYVLTSLNDSDEEDGKDIYIYKWGLDDGPLGGSQPDTLQYLQYISINSIAGIGEGVGLGPAETVPLRRPVRWITKNTRDGLFYLGVESSDEVYAISMVPDEDEVFNAVATGPQGIGIQIHPFPAPLGFSRWEYGAGTSVNWQGVGEIQSMRAITDVMYVPPNNSFVSLTMLVANRSKDWFDLGQNVVDDFSWRRRNYSFITEVGAGGVFESDLPSRPSADDPRWGTLSGTLPYQISQENGAMFPTGQFTQLQYQLNADPAHTKSPYLTSSQISQGLRVEGVPAGGTKTIYLRTNIPVGTPMAEQTGRLKVFWELQE
jgi:hypothetical protein